MAKKKRKIKPGRQSKSKSVFIKTPSPTEDSLIATLAEKRSGGRQSIRGFYFQFKYAAWKLLDYLEPKSAKEGDYIHLEGVDDLDQTKVSAEGTATEFIQVKYSKNRIDVGTFWDKGILQNFAEACSHAPNSRFRLVHNMDFAKGFLTRLASASSEKTALPAEDLAYWQTKFEALHKDPESSKDINWETFDLAGLLGRLEFEQISDSELDKKITERVIRTHDISSGNERQYMKALYWFVLEGSRQGRKIHCADLSELIESVREDIARGAINPAVQGKWLASVNFEAQKGKNISAYFEGKAARPADIAAGLPAARPKWEEEIINTLHDADVVIVRASSGQGKSTLAWQVASGLRAEGWKPYELAWCGEEKEIGNIGTFIESRVRIGELPLVVIDGLRTQVSAWAELAKATVDFPVKYLVTAREEDWYRFGADRSNLRLKTIEVSMTGEEAENIFERFKKADRLHSTITHWQPAWENVRDSGLLIEYVYLLTQGEMLEQRLSAQVKLLNEDVDGRAKLEILRLVSVADICNVSLPIGFLVDSVEQRRGFAQDPGECLKSLQSEYYIRFKGEDSVQGLHPVRSEHLVNLLHETLALSDTLRDLLPILKSTDLEQFCAHAPLLVAGGQRAQFLEDLATYLSDAPYTEMTMAIDGLLATDAFEHWQVNKEIYDQVAHALPLFGMDVFPWSGLNILGRLSDIFDGHQRENIGHLQALKDRIERFDPERSNTYAFLNALASRLTGKGVRDNAVGVGRLAMWCMRFGLHLPVLQQLDKSEAWQLMKSLALEDAGELSSAFFESIPDLYLAVYESWKPELIGWIKRETNTLGINEAGSDLRIEYLVDFEHGVSPNDQSVSRINIVRLFLPQYSIYSSQGLRPPVPGQEFLLQDKDDSVKHMPAENVSNFFQTHVNRIWLNSISVHYEPPTVFDWQKRMFDLRTQSLELVKVSTKYFENLLEHKSTHSPAAQIDKRRPEVLHQLSQIGEFPKRLDERFETERFENALKQIRDWAHSWENFLNQMTALSKGDEHLPNLNLQSARRQLGGMQEATDLIASDTFAYFDLIKLKDQEANAYYRLAQTVDFFVNSQQPGVVFQAKDRIANWWSNTENARMAAIKQALDAYKEISGFDYILPTQTIEDGVLRKASIGINGLRWERLDEQLEDLTLCLLQLAELDVDFYYFVPVAGQCAQVPLAMVLPKDYLHRVQKAISENTALEAQTFGNPLPAILDESILEALPGISIPISTTNPAFEAISEILLGLWQIGRIRERVSDSVAIEAVWSIELQKPVIAKIGRALKTVESQDDFGLAEKYRSIIQDVIENRGSFVDEDFRQLYQQDITELAEAVALD